MGELKTKGLPSAFDEQIKTPEHDELCLELLKPEILGKTIIEFGLDEKINNFLETNIDNLDQRKLQPTYFEQVEYKLEKEELTKQGSIEKKYTGYFLFSKKIYKRKSAIANIKYNLKLEHPLTSKNFLIGVVDFKLNLLPELNITYSITNEIYQTPLFDYVGYSKPQIIADSYSGSEMEKHKTFCKEQGKLIGTKETYATYTINSPQQDRYSGIITEGVCTILIEVKPKILSIGEVTRQLRVYQEYGHYPVALFTKKQEYSELFKSQGFLFCALEKISSTSKQIGLGDYQ